MKLLWNETFYSTHHNQSLLECEKSVECLTMRVHFASDNPNPESAPYRPAMVWQKHVSIKKPTQLKMKLTKNAVTNTMSVPSNPLSLLISPSPDSMAINAISFCWFGMGALIEWWIGGGGGGLSICGIGSSSFKIFSIWNETFLR